MRRHHAATYLRGLNTDEAFARQSLDSEYYLRDALGSTIGVTDPSGGVITTYSYDPFGGASAVGDSANTLQYTGRENDGTGLYFYRYRYYYPAFARFISEDPLGRGNRYAFVDNNPMRWIDPLGLLTVAISGGYEIVPLAGGTSYSSGGYWSIGNGAGLFNTFGSNNTGLAASAGISVALYKGDVSQFMGPYSNWNLQTPRLGGSVYYNSCGEFMGFGIGLGLGIGFSSTQTNTVPAAQAPAPSTVWQSPLDYNPLPAPDCSGAVRTDGRK